MNSASFSISMSYAVPTALQLRLTSNPALAKWARHMTSYRTQNTAYFNSATLCSRPGTAIQPHPFGQPRLTSPEDRLLQNRQGGARYFGWHGQDYRLSSRGYEREARRDFRVRRTFRGGARSSFQAVVLLHLKDLCTWSGDAPGLPTTLFELGRPREGRASVYLLDCFVGCMIGPPDFRNWGNS
jgi:hypothetical protein